MATKAETVKVRVAVIYNHEGNFIVGGHWRYKRKLSDAALIRDAKDSGYGHDDLPHTCIVDIELPIPKPLKGKVLSVKAVKPTKATKKTEWGSVRQKL